MSVYGQSQVASAMARPAPMRTVQAGPMAGMGGSYTPARLSAELQHPAPAPGINGAGNMGSPTPQQLPQNGVRYGIGGSASYIPYSHFNGGTGGVGQRYNFTSAADTAAAGAQAPNAVQPQGGPDDNSLEAIQAEMKRRQVGAQLNQNPDNSALAGYQMGQ